MSRKVHEVLLRPGDADDTSIEDVAGLALTQMGFDSLMAIELRRWLRVAMGLQLSVLEIVGSGTFGQLVHLILDKLADKLHREEEEEEERGSVTTPPA